MWTYGQSQTRWEKAPTVFGNFWITLLMPCKTASMYCTAFAPTEESHWRIEESHWRKSPSVGSVKVWDQLIWRLDSCALGLQGALCEIDSHKRPFFMSQVRSTGKAEWVTPLYHALASAPPQLQALVSVCATSSWVTPAADDWVLPGPWVLSTYPELSCRECWCVMGHHHCSVDVGHACTVWFTVPRRCGMC